MAKPSKSDDLAGKYLSTQKMARRLSDAARNLAELVSLADEAAAEAEYELAVHLQKIGNYDDGVTRFAHEFRDGLHRVKADRHPKTQKRQTETVRNQNRDNRASDQSRP